MKIHPQIEVELAKPEHLSRIMELWESSMQFHNTIDSEFFNSNALDKDLYLTVLELSLEYQPIFILRVGDKIEGFATIEEVRIGFSHCNNIPYCKIGDFVISEIYRRRGFGKRLFNKIIKWAKKQGIRRIDLNVYAKNQQAMNFYRELGLDVNFYSMSFSMP